MTAPKTRRRSADALVREVAGGVVSVLSGHRHAACTTAPKTWPSRRSGLQARRRSAVRRSELQLRRRHAFTIPACPSAPWTIALAVAALAIGSRAAADLTLVRDGAPNASIVLVGDSTLAAGLGLDSADFGLEEILVAVRDNSLVILGDDEKPAGGELRGTLWAASVFLEEVLGVRWLWPGELGRVVPTQPTISVLFDLGPHARDRGLPVDLIE